MDPNDFESHLLLGLIRRQAFDQERARAHLERALALRPGDPGVRYQLALVAIAAGELDGARLRGSRRSSREHPKFSEAHVSLAMVYYRLKRKEDGDREQAIVRELAREKQEREQAERDKAEREKTQPAPPP